MTSSPSHSSHPQFCPEGWDQPVGLQGERHSLGVNGSPAPPGQVSASCGGAEKGRGVDICVSHRGSAATSKAAPGFLCACPEQ